MLINIILFACFYPVALIIWLVLRNEAKPKKNLILGVTLPHDAREDGAVKDAVRKFRLRENIIFVVLTLLALPEFILNRDSVMILWMFVWIIFAIVLPGIPYIFANRALKDLKNKNGWFGEAAGRTLVDTRLAAQPKKLLSVWLFVPAAVLAFMPVIHTVITLRGRDEFWPALAVFLTFFILTATSYFLYKIIFRQRAEVVGEDTSLNAALTQIRRYHWGRCWILIAWLTAVFGILIWLFGMNTAAILPLSLGYSALLLFFVMHAEFKTRKMQQKLTAESGAAVYTDDDDKWLFGAFYNNPDDSHFIVNKRTGIGTTINLAKTPGKILIAFTALILLAMPGIGLWLMHEESTPVSLDITRTRLVASHTGEVYALDVKNITSVWLLDKLPSGTRTNGTAMDTILKGSFRLDGLGPCRLCLNPQVPPFIAVKTAEYTYIFGSSTADGTRAVFGALLSLGVPAGAT